MKKVALYVGCSVLCLILFCSETVKAAKGSVSGSIGSKNAIAKVLKVTPGEDNDWMAAVTDPKSPTGYSVKVKQHIYPSFFKTYFLIFIFSRKNPTDELKYVFSRNICFLLDPGNKDYPKENFMPRQIINIILPGRYGSCNITDTTVPIKASGPINTDPEARNVTLPESSPYELVVNILPVKFIGNPDTRYYFQVIFGVAGDVKASGSIGGSTGGKKGGSGGAGGGKTG